MHAVHCSLEYPVRMGISHVTYLTCILIRDIGACDTGGAVPINIVCVRNIRCHIGGGSPIYKSCT